MTTYWIGVAAREHVRAGVEGGFAQLGHGKMSAIGALRKGDWIVYYSPRTSLEDGEKVQAFTSVGRVTSDEPYQVDMRNGLKPYRVDVDYVDSAREAGIRTLLDQLELTRHLGNGWGIALRRSKIKISAVDFETIAQAMGVDMQS
jgi:hypothetical protein